MSLTAWHEAWIRESRAISGEEGKSSGAGDKNGGMLGENGKFFDSEKRKKKGGNLS